MGIVRIGAGRSRGCASLRRLAPRRRSLPDCERRRSGSSSLRPADRPRRRDVRGRPRRRSDALKDGLQEGIAFLEEATGLSFGDRRQPLLVSVRSGAARSMPGMLDSLLDVGCTTLATRGLIRMTGNPRFAWDCRRRLLEGWAETVLGLDAADLAAKAQRSDRRGGRLDRPAPRQRGARAAGVDL